ncbi:hypothetical protein D3C74_491310 [compost metagenome]
MQMARATIDQPAGIRRGRHDLVHPLGADQLGFMAIVQRCQALLLAAKGGELRRSVGQFAKAPAQVAIDVVRAD